MNILTIRATDQQSSYIEKLKEFFGIGHASKALLLAAEELPKLNFKFTELKQDYYKLEQKHNNLIMALNEKEKIQSKIDDLTKL